MKLNGWLPALLFATIILIMGYIYFSKKQTAAKKKTLLSLMGAPGTGKGTLAAKSIKNPKISSLSTGNLLRKEIDLKTDLGKEAEQYMSQGKLVPDELIISMVDKWLTNNLTSVEILLLDGFPRTARQADMFLNLLRNKYKNASLRVVELVLSDEAIIERLSDRLICEKCQAPYSRKLFKADDKWICEICGGQLKQRSDDKEDVIRNRLKVYDENLKPLIDIYKKGGITINRIDIEGKTPEQVFEQFKDVLKVKDKPEKKS